MTGQTSRDTRLWYILSALDAHLREHFPFKGRWSSIGHLRSVSRHEEELALQVHLQEEARRQRAILRGIRLHVPAGTGVLGSDSDAENWFMAELARELAHVREIRHPFSTCLRSYMKKKGRDHVSVYKEAGLDRRLFSKILTQEGYLPSKRTAVALAMALHLDETEAEELLYRAGYSLSPNILFDSIVLFFLSRGHHDIFTLNEALVAYGLDPLQKLRAEIRKPGPRISRTRGLSASWGMPSIPWTSTRMSWPGEGRPWMPLKLWTAWTTRMRRKPLGAAGADMSCPGAGTGLAMTSLALPMPPKRTETTEPTDDRRAR